MSGTEIKVIELFFEHGEHKMGEREREKGSGRKRPVRDKTAETRNNGERSSFLSATATVDARLIQSSPYKEYDATLKM